MSRPDAGTLALAGMAAAACGAAAWLGLTAVATPSDAKTRHAELETRVARLEGTADAARRASVSRPDAACPGLGESELAVVKQQVLTMSGQAGVTLTDLVATQPANLDGHGRLAPVALRLQATGPYEKVRTLLEHLGEAQPQIFVESLDLTSAAPNVKLKLTGKVFCWTSARQ